MKLTSREIVKKTLRFESPQRLPRDLWVLLWAEKHHPEELKKLRELYPSDFICPPNIYKDSEIEKGDPYSVGKYTDPWGCVFTNVHDGIIGEVKEPLMKDITDLASVNFPYEIMPDDEDAAIAKINQFCNETDKFVFAGCCPRPWERMQFLRSTVNAMMDIMTDKEASLILLRKMQDFYRKQMNFWAKTDVDSLMFMDDWGSQTNLLIPPDLWREIFKPLYKEYVEIAHASGKFIFMHSDGNIAQIYPDLIEIGVDAVNSQLFCMDMDELSKIAKGKITFWGEIDRQHIMPDPDVKVAREGVRKVAKNLYDPAGGIIAQFEFSPGLQPANAFAVYEEWDKVHSEAVRGKM